MGEVLIKNVEMPMHCAMCGFHGAMSDPMISQHFCKVTGVRILNPYKGRLDDCPLVYVPKHGRLIDADALLNLLNNCMFPSDMVTTMAVRMATNWIKEAPTIIEVEEGK